MQVGIGNNESYLSQATMLSAYLLTQVPKKPMVVAASTLAGAVAYSLSNTDSMAIKSATILASAAATGYTAHRVYDLAEKHLCKKVGEALIKLGKELQALAATLQALQVATREDVEQPSSLSANGVIPQSVEVQLAYTNSSSVKQTMIRLVAARAYINNLASDDEKRAVSKEVMKKVFDGATSQERALELLSTEKGTTKNKARLEDLALGSKNMPKNALTGLDKASRFVGKNELHKFLQALIELNQK